MSRRTRRLPSELDGVSGGAVLWTGPSRFDRTRAPIVAIATGILGGSTNGKTGTMVQTWILRRDIPPGDASRLGADSVICGDCVHRHVDGLGTCYVNVGWGPTRIWKSFRAGLYPRATPAIRAAIQRQHVRIGSYGDPVAVPARVWRSIMPDNAKGATGYTHAWRSPKARGYSEFLMASVESRAEAEEARARGWRSFLLVPLNRAIPDGFLWCPGDALNPATKLPCSRCGACAGTRGRSKADVAMYVHGTAAATFAPGRQRLSTVGLERRPHLAYDPLVRMEKDLHAELKAHCAARGVRMKRWLDAVVRERLAAESDDV